MIPQINVDERRAVHHWAVATTNPFFEQNRSTLEALFYMSLEAHNGNYSVIDLQQDLLVTMISADRVRNRYHRYKTLFGKARVGLAKVGAKLDRLRAAQERFEEMSDIETSARWFRDKIRFIGDGVAWRGLNYDRAILRLLSEHAPVAVPQFNKGLLTELGVLLELSESNNRLVLNAITNFLRVGDITVISDKADDIRLVEVKAGSRTTARTLRQGAYLTLIQQGIESGIHPLGSMRMRKVITRQPVSTQIPILENAIKQAEERLASSRLFGDYMALAVFATDRIVDEVPEPEQERLRASIFDRFYKVRKSKSDVLLPPIDSLFLMNYFSPNAAPYAVFQIEPRYRLKLITGEIAIFTTINLSGFARWLRKRGWDVQILVPDEDTKDPNLQYIPAMRVDRGAASIEVDATIFLTAAIELWQPETLEMTIKVIFEDIPPSTRVMKEQFLTVNYPNHGKWAWD